MCSEGDSFRDLYFGPKTRGGVEGGLPKISYPLWSNASIYRTHQIPVPFLAPVPAKFPNSASLCHIFLIFFIRSSNYEISSWKICGLSYLQKCGSVILKGTVAPDFRPPFFTSKEPLEPLIHIVHCLLNLVSNSWSYLNWSSTPRWTMQRGVKSLLCIMQGGVNSHRCIIQR